MDRARLLEWLRKPSAQERDEDERPRKVRKALQKAELENGQLRTELRKLGRPDPFAWTVLSEGSHGRSSGRSADCP
jgi:hypothetical protein